MLSPMKKLVVSHADLTLIISLEQIINVGNGRLNRLIKQAVKEALKEADKLQLPPRSENKTILDMFEKLKKETGWNNGARHPLTFINFCLMILEKYKYQKINDILVEIMDFFERAGNAPQPCFWAALIAYEKWERIVETS